MEPRALERCLRQAAVALASPSRPSAAEVEAARQLAAGKLRKVSGNVAVMPVQGPIENRMSFLGYIMGWFNCESGRQALSALVADRDVSAIVLDVDSPGGTSEGVEEFADQIAAARETKPVYAIADAMACSAAFWIASAATALYCVPSGCVGSVGVYATHVDYSAAMAEDGINVTVLKAGKYKAEWLPYSPLTDDAKEYAQEQVDTLYTRFVAAVAKYRGTDAADVKKNYGQGRVVDARPAAAAGMIDGVMTMDALLGKLTGSAAASGASGRRTSVEVLRLRHRLAQSRTPRPS
jgi:signal peptide peptidase SppA